MAATPLSPPPRAPLLPSAVPSVMLPRHHDTAAGPVTVDLLRRLHPADLLLPEGRVLGLDDWYRHGRQSREFVLVATRAAGPHQRVLGQLELRFDAPLGPAGGADGAGPRRGMIDRIVVAPEHRGAGIGTALLRTALVFARANGVGALREFVPGLLALVERDGDRRWLEYEPGPGEFGGVRSLVVTAKACALERIPCLVVRPTRDRPAATHSPVVGRDRPRELLGAVLEVLLAPAPRPVATIGVLRPAATSAEVLARLRAEIAALAGIAWPEADAEP